MIRLDEIVFSSCSTAQSDDFYGFCRNRAGLHIWVVDGATSVSDRPCRMRPDMRDPAWFARALTAGMMRLLRFDAAPGGLTQGRLAPLLAGLRVEYLRRAGPDLQSHDMPIAAMSYLCLRERGRTLDVTGLQYADCFFGLSAAWPRRAAGRLAPLPGAPTNASLPRDPALMQRLRERRRAQVEDLASSAIGLRPESAFCGAPIRLRHHGPGALMIGTDGFARIYEEYGLQSVRETRRRVMIEGALPTLTRIREFENGEHAARLSIKPADDVTLITASFVPGRPGDAPRRWVARQNASTRHLVNRAVWPF